MIRFVRPPTTKQPSTKQFVGTHYEKISYVLIDQEPQTETEDESEKLRKLQIYN